MPAAAAALRSPLPDAAAGIAAADTMPPPPPLPASNVRRHAPRDDATRRLPLVLNAHPVTSQLNLELAAAEQAAEHAAAAFAAMCALSRSGHVADCSQSCLPACPYLLH